MAAGMLLSVRLAVLPVLPRLKPPRLLPPVLNNKSVLVVAALVKLVAMGSTFRAPAPLIAACETMALGWATCNTKVPPLMLVAPTVALL